MSLNFSVENVENYDENYPATEDNRWNPITEEIVFASMAVGLGKITDKTAPEFYARMQIFAANHGFVYSSTASDIKNHVGFSVNVSDETRSQWFKRTIRPAIDEAVDGCINKFKEMV